MRKITVAICICIAMIFASKSNAQEWGQIDWQSGNIENTEQLGNTLYGINTGGIFRSSDWGKTWSLFRKGLVQSSIQYEKSYEQHFILDQNTIIYQDFGYLTNPSLFEKGFFFSHENDTSWTFRKTSAVKGLINSIPYKFISKDSILSFSYDHSLPDSTGYYLSTDGGITWQRRMNGIKNIGYAYSCVVQGKRTFASFQFADTITGKLTFSHYKTDNLGISWEKLNGSFTDSTEVFLSVVSDSILIAQTYTRNGETSSTNLYQSTNSGNSWRKTEGDVPNEKEMSTGKCKQIGSKTFFISDGLSLYNNVILVSKDSGFHWIQIPLLDSILLYNLKIYGTDNHYIFSHHLSSWPTEYFETDSNFKTFTPVVLQSGNSGYSGLHYVTGKTLFSSGRNDSLTISINNGNTWLSQPFLEDYRQTLSKWIKDGSKLYTIGKQISSNKPCVFRSDDDGKNWSVLSVIYSMSNIIELLVHDDTLILVSRNYPERPEILYSIDAGSTWASTFPHYWGFDMEKVSFNFLNGSLYAFDKNTIFYTTDFGLRWFSKVSKNIPGNYVGGAYILGDKWFFTISDINNENKYSLYFTSDLGTSWVKASGLDTTMSVSPVLFEHHFLFGSGYDPSKGQSAVLYSRDSGRTWNQLGDRFTNAYDLYSGSEYYFIGGEELWRLPKSSLPLSAGEAKSSPTISITNCFPNPAATEMRISYTIPKRSDVNLTVFDITGKEITTLTSETNDAGSHVKLWNTRSLSNGSYILKLSACGESVSKIVEVVK